MTDELVVLIAPKKIENLGDYYDDFAELSDEEIVHCLEARRKVMEEAAIRMVHEVGMILNDCSN